jgi:hypothetical protein
MSTDGTGEQRPLSVAGALASASSQAASAAPLAFAGLVALLWVSQPSLFWAPCPLLSPLLLP